MAAPARAQPQWFSLPGFLRALAARSPRLSVLPFPPSSLLFLPAPCGVAVAMTYTHAAHDKESIVTAR